MVARRKRVTPAPTSSTIPVPSWPRIRPTATVARSPLRMCRSVPQIVVLLIRTTASVASRSAGLGLFLELLLSGTVVDEGFHEGVFRGFKGGVGMAEGGKARRGGGTARPRRNSEADSPAIRRKTRLNWESDWKPEA